MTIKQLREAHGMTRTAFGKACGLSGHPERIARTVNRWEVGKLPIPPKAQAVIDELAESIGIIPKQEPTAKNHPFLPDKDRKNELLL